jgi:hypothetical protein
MDVSTEDDLEWEEIGGERIYFEEDAELGYEDLNEEAKAQYDLDEYGGI